MTYEPAQFVDQSIVPALYQCFMQVTAEFLLPFGVYNPGPVTRIPQGSCSISQRSRPVVISAA